MFSTDKISFTQIKDEFLPKIAREYDMLPQQLRSSRVQPKDRDSGSCLPLISTGWFSSFCSNNQFNLSSPQERKKKGKEEERASPNYLQWIIMGSITAIATAFGLGRLHSSIDYAEKNIEDSDKLLQNKSDWNTAVATDTVSGICNVTKTYRLAEINRKNKLVNYQSSLLGIAVGTGIGIVGACMSQQLLGTIGLVTAVASAAFGVYHIAIHWDDFAKAQTEFRSLKLMHLIPREQLPPYAPEPGWNVPPY